MAKDMKEYIDVCDVCSKISSFIDFWLLNPLKANYPFKSATLDTGHITMPSGNKKYIVVAIDRFMRWIAVKNLTFESSHRIMNFI